MSERVQLILHHQLSKVVKAYEKGMDIQDIARRISVSPPTVSRWLRQEGYRYRRRGHYPKAMRMRAQELQERGWPNERIAKLLRVSSEHVQDWLGRKSNPILGGERDPLKLKGAKGKKKGIQKGTKKKHDKPPTHRCRKYWTADEERYVFGLIKKKTPIISIYRHMRASRNRQLLIWRKLGGKGRPPNFPPKKPLPCFPEALEVPPGVPEKEIEQLRKEARKLVATEDKAIKALEIAYKNKQKRALELQAAIEAEDEKAEGLEAERREKVLEIRAAEERVEALEAWKKRAKPPALPPAAPKRRVTAGSYEAEVLGLPVGSIIKKPKEPRVRLKKAIAEWADNGEFFEVSNEWGDLGELNDDKGATEDELQIFADFLTKEGFPAKVTPKGDQPRAHLQDLWPKNIERKWTKATERAIIFLDAYTARKRKLTESKFSPKIAQNILRYLRNAYDAFRNPDTTPRQRSKAEARMKRIWQGLDTIDRRVLIFRRGFADRSGTPTQKALEWGITAKRLLVKEDEGRIAKHLGKRKKAREKESARGLLEARKRELGLLPPEEEE